MSRSDQMRLELSVKMGCGRMCSYCPQELYISRYKELSQKKDITLTLKTIEEISVNIPGETIISWTGFTEPFDCPDFGEIVMHFAKRGMRQTISTTLYGLSGSQEFFAQNLGFFNEGITLHLPDSNGYMKGKFDEKYAGYLERVVSSWSAAGSVPSMVLFLIGDEFHSSIRDAVARFQKAHGEDKVIKAKYLNSRSGSIVVSTFGLKTTEKIRGDGEPHYCSYKRLNRGVMLPNAQVTICSQDYGLEGILGSLREMTLPNIYDELERDAARADSFRNGTFSPCVKCEHYSPVGRSATTGRVS